MAQQPAASTRSGAVRLSLRRRWRTDRAMEAASRCGLDAGDRHRPAGCRARLLAGETRSLRDLVDASALGRFLRRPCRHGAGFGTAREGYRTGATEPGHACWRTEPGRRQPAAGGSAGCRRGVVGSAPCLFSVRKPAPARHARCGPGGRRHRSWALCCRPNAASGGGGALPSSQPRNSRQPRHSRWPPARGRTGHAGPQRRLHCLV